MAPSHVDSYVHRVGRTARAGKEGMAVLLLPEYGVPFRPIIKSPLLEKRAVLYPTSLATPSRSSPYLELYRIPNGSSTPTI